MRPVNIEASLYKIPTRKVQQNSTHTFSEYEYIVTRVEFDGWIEGIG